MIEKILIANRAEIAVRIIKTARNYGYRTVAVYSEADADTLHVQMADEAVLIGAPAASASYLVAEKILDAAKKTGADAIHPGYGFLSENADFARACEKAGIIFIGPGSDAIELMGNKRLSKIAMLDAGVPCIPGYQGKDQSDDVLKVEAGKIGYPVMVKAAAGGGGRGLRLVFEASALAEELKTARSEAQSAFGSGELILEKALIEPRHIEIQVFADTLGNVVYLGERDCSIQRRHQKVVEEAPSPFVDEKLRREMGQAAVNVAKACGYRSAGTVEFLVDKDKNFYFLEMNTRLQVEHPVTELITGLDLVAWQIKVAQGNPLPLTQEEISLNGHAIEVRLYAEDARQNFLPQTGKVLGWDIPERNGVRVDSGICDRQIISPHYDPMLAKVIAWGDNRDQARRRLASFLQDMLLLGLNNNKLFLERIIRHPQFAQGSATTAFIEEHFQTDISMANDALSAKSLALAAMLMYRFDSSLTAASTWHKPAGYGYNYKIGCQDKTYAVTLMSSGSKFKISAMEQELELESVSTESNTLIYLEQNVRKKAGFALDNGKVYLDDGRGHFAFEDVTRLPAVAAGMVGSGEVKADMEGLIIDVRVKVGDAVEIGQTLIVLEAMKMEHPLKATVNGTVESVLISAGTQVKTRQLLMVLAEKEIEAKNEAATG
jgi:geranyl-CoA carboxylase alpha subunit